MADPSSERITLGGESDNNSFSATGTWYMGTDVATIIALLSEAGTCDQAKEGRSTSLQGGSRNRLLHPPKGCLRWIVPHEDDRILWPVVPLIDQFFPFFRCSASRLLVAPFTVHAVQSISFHTGLKL